MRIAVHFEKNADLIARVKQIDGARWSQQKTLWHIPDTEENRVRFHIAPLAHSLPSAEGTAQIEKLKQWMHSKRYSESTTNTYSEAFNHFWYFTAKNQLPKSQMRTLYSTIMIIY